MSWTVIIAPFLVGAIVLFVPGLLVAISLKMRGIDAFGIAPALSVAMVSVSAIVAPMVGIGWALWVPLAFALVVAALGFVIQLSVTKISGRYRVESTERTASSEVAAVRASSPLVPMQWFSRQQGLYWLSFLLGFILLARNVTNAVGQPQWISQTYDNNFHLNAIRYIQDTANASSLAVGGMTAGDNPAEFYPAAWHGVVSLIFMGSNTTIPIATNAMVLLTAAVIWPLGVIFMTRSLFRLNAPAILAVGALSAAFSAFPVLLMYFGVLYPNLLGIALMPAGVAVVVQMFRLSKHTMMSITQTIYLGVFVALSIAVAHPNAMMSLLVFIIPIFIARAVLHIKASLQQRTPWWTSVLTAVGIALILWLIYYLWGVIRPPKEAGIAWGPKITQAQALGEAALNATMASSPQWLIVLLFIVGLFALFIRRDRMVWLVASWGIIAFFYAAARSLPWDQDRYWVVGVWYHDSFRLAALVPLATLPIAIWGLHWVCEKIAHSSLGVLAAEKFSAREAVRSSGSAMVAGVLSILAVLGVTYFGQQSKSLNAIVETSYWAYAPDDHSALLSPGELDVIDHVDDFVPEDSKILVQPFTGSALAYALADREVSATHVLWTRSPNEEYIEHNLNKAATDPKVCEILHEENYEYYLDFGKWEVLEGGDHSAWFPGYENLKDSGVLTPVYSNGPATLYKISACQ